MKKKMSYPSIRAAFLIAIACAVAPALGVITWFSVKQGKILTEQAKMETRRQAEAFASIQQRITDEVQQLLRTIASMPAFINRDTESMVASLKALHASYPEYINFTALDAKGFVIASSLLPIGTDLSSREYLHKTVRTNRFTPGEYVLSAVNPEPSFPFIYPIRNSRGEPIGGVVTIFKLTSYGPLYERLDLPTESVLALIDRKGKRLFFYPPKGTNPIGESTKESIWDKLSSLDNNGVFVDRGSDGIERFYAFKALRYADDPEPYMYVVYASPTSAVLASSRNNLLASLATMIAVAIFAMGSGVVLSRFLFGKRLDRIISMVSRIKDGHLSARMHFEEDASDLGQIAKALDLMAETVERRDIENGAYTERLTSSLAEKEALLKEVHHRVKNNLQLILSLIRLQGDADRGNDKMDGKAGALAFEAAMENRISAMALVHEMLYETESDGGVDLAEYAGRIIDMISESRGIDSAFNVKVNAERIWATLDKAIPFGLLLNELSVNAYKYAFHAGKPTHFMVSLRREGDRAFLEVADDGPGLPPDFSPSNNRGIGLRIADALANQLGGTLVWGNEDGAHFRIDFPIQPPIGSGRTARES